MQEGKQADPQAGSPEDRLEVAGWRAGSQACRQAGWQISRHAKIFFNISQNAYKYKIIYKNCLTCVLLPHKIYGMTPMMQHIMWQY